MFTLVESISDGFVLTAWNFQTLHIIFCIVWHFRYPLLTDCCCSDKCWFVSVCTGPVVLLVVSLINDRASGLVESIVSGHSGCKLSPSGITVYLRVGHSATRVTTVDMGVRLWVWSEVLVSPWTIWQRVVSVVALTTCFFCSTPSFLG